MSNEDKILNAIASINKCIPSLSDIGIHTQMDVQNAEYIRESFILSVKKDYKKGSSLLDEFMRNTVNKKHFTFFGFSLLEEMEEDNRYRYFGALDVDYLGEDKITKEIVLVDRFDNPEENTFLVAQDFEMLLELIIILKEYDSMAYKRGKYSKSIRQIFHDRIRRVIGNTEKYDHIINSIPLD